MADWLRAAMERPPASRGLAASVPRAAGSQRGSRRLLGRGSDRRHGRRVRSGRWRLRRRGGQNAVSAGNAGLRQHHAGRLGPHEHRRRNRQYADRAAQLSPVALIEGETPPRQQVDENDAPNLDPFHLKCPKPGQRGEQGQYPDDGPDSRPPDGSVGLAPGGEKNERLQDGQGRDANLRRRDSLPDAPDEIVDLPRFPAEGSSMPLREVEFGKLFRYVFGPVQRAGRGLLRSVSASLPAGCSSSVVAAISRLTARSNVQATCISNSLSMMRNRWPPARTSSITAWCSIAGCWATA